MKFKIHFFLSAILSWKTNVELMEEMPKTLLKPDDLKSEVDMSFKILDENVNIGQIKKVHVFDNSCMGNT